jgi:hypothetical protein
MATKLNPKQEEFCQLYVNGDRELFGNGTQCYLEVYGRTDKEGKKMSYMVAAAAASRELKKVNVIERINGLLEMGGFNDENVDKQHLFLINQHADFKTKLGAIREYNELKKRMSKNISLNDGQPFTLNVINYGNNDTLLVQPKRLSTTNPTEPSKIQGDCDASSKWEIKDSIERPDKEGTTQ